MLLPPDDRRVVNNGKREVCKIVAAVEYAVDLFSDIVDAGQVLLRLCPHLVHRTQALHHIVVNSLLKKAANRLRLCFDRKQGHAASVQPLNRRRVRNDAAMQHMIRGLAVGLSESVQIGINSLVPQLRSKDEQRCDNGNG